MRQPETAIREAARKAASAHENLNRAIRDAYPALSLRKIAEVAGMSHEQVRRIVRS